MRIAVAIAAALLLWPAVSAATGPPRPADLEAEIVCPTCKTTLDQSSSPIAARMKAFIREEIAAGKTSAQIKAQLVDQFGPGVIAEPRKHGFDLLAWLLPIGALAAGTVVVGALAWSWSRRRDDVREPPPLHADLERRVDAELAHYEDE